MYELYRISMRSPQALRLVVLALCLVVPGALPAHAGTYNLATMLTNPGFESGITDWTYTGADVNPNTYLTASEWASQTWSASSPFYSDANLATYYPGRPWGVDPDITHIDQTGIPGDPTTVITAPMGAHFVGSRQDGYDGHYRRDPSEPPQPDGGYYDTNFQLTSVAIYGTFLAGDTFTLTVWGVRGRLWQDWASQNASSSGSASRLSVKLTGGSFQNATFDFTNWGPDGNWASETFTWQLLSNTPSIRVVITGQNHNHDRFVAVDTNWEPTVPTQPRTWGAIKALYADD